MKEIKLILLALIILLFLCEIPKLNSIKMRNTVKMERNIFNSCVSEVECNECSQENYYKKCDMVCYCCSSSDNDQIENKCFSQKD